MEDNEVDHFAERVHPTPNDRDQMNDVRQARDKAQYNRQQKGHSLVLHILLAFLIIGLFTIPYYSLSPNHYWHA